MGGGGGGEGGRGREMGAGGGQGEGQSSRDDTERGMKACRRARTYVKCHRSESRHLFNVDLISSSELCSMLDGGCHEVFSHRAVEPKLHWSVVQWCVFSGVCSVVFVQWCLFSGVWFSGVWFSGVCSVVCVQWCVFSGVCSVVCSSVVCVQ